MNKPKIKAFAAFARKHLKEEISKTVADECAADRAAFIWFSRIIAAHFMKVNGFLPRADYSFDILPDIFEKIPQGVMDINTDIITKKLELSDNDDFKKPDIIGWLYQYYNSDAKDEAFALLQSNIKVSKERIPAATQIFTPDWIVKYLVESSVGAYCGEKFSHWSFYIENKLNLTNDITKVKLIDPCMGCGHILLYAFDVFMDLYKNSGYDEASAASLILQNNLYGIDIDDRAYRLAYFSLIMKAAGFDRDILNKNMSLNLCSLKEDGGLFRNAKEYGSLMRIESCPQSHPLYFQAEMLTRKYDIVVTNPPYMGRKSLNSNLRSFIDTHYSDGKSELYSAFMIACTQMLKDGGICAMITIHSWMFISSFEKLRSYILNNTTILSMVHTGAATFEEISSFNALSTAFCLRKGFIKDYPSVFVRLADYYTKDAKLKNFHNPADKYVISQGKFKSIPKTPLIYWVSENVRKVFEQSKPLSYYCSPKQGLATGDNKSFVKYWHQVPKSEIGFECEDVSHFHRTGKKYAPYNKGGGHRKWYGSNEFVIKFDEESYTALSKQGNNLPSRQYYFKEGITWSLFGFENFSVRYKPMGFVFDVSGSSVFPEEYEKYILAFLSSKVAFLYLSVIAPTVNFQVGNIASLPLIIDKTRAEELEALANENIAISKEDWDSFETSWDFKSHPLVSGKGLIFDSFERWKAVANGRYDRLRRNEEQINKIFIDIYGLHKELTPEVAHRDIAMRKADLKRDIKSLISFAVGCMFGRYGGGKGCGFISLDDDILSEFEAFVKNSFGHEQLEQNLDFIAKALESSGKPSREVIKKYLKMHFYNDHFKTYKKHPVYIPFEKDGKMSLKYIHS